MYRLDEQAVPEPEREGNIDDEGYRTFVWGGQYHRVPEDFKFPKTNIKLMWDLWWMGKESERISPFRRLRSDDLTGYDKALFSKVKSVMEVLRNDKEEAEIRNMSIVERDAHFETALPVLTVRAFGHNNMEVSNIGKLQVSSIYDLMARRDNANRPEPRKRRRSHQQQQGSERRHRRQNESSHRSGEQTAQPQPNEIAALLRRQSIHNTPTKKQNIKIGETNYNLKFISLTRLTCSYYLNPGYVYM